MLICGASFAGLAVARELAGSGADVLVIDRYEIGERQTSACGIPTGWLAALELRESLQQTFGELVDPHPPHDRPLRPAVDVLDVRLPDAVRGARPRRGRSSSRPRRSTGRDRRRRVTPTAATIRAALIVDGLGWRRVLGVGDNVQPPDARLSRGLEVHPFGSGKDMEVWIDRSYVPAGYGWSFPAESEVRIGVGSFDPRFHVREPTVRLASDLHADRSATRATGSRTRCATPPRTACSSSATPPGTACR